MAPRKRTIRINALARGWQADKTVYMKIPAMVLDCLLLVLLLVFLPVDASLADDVSQKKAGPMPHLQSMSGAKFDKQAPTYLKGEIEHSSQLAPVGIQLRTGAQYTEGALGAEETDNKWYQIPAWFAGVWKANSETRTYLLDYQSMRTNYINQIFPLGLEEQWGCQQDAQDNVWDFSCTPYTTVVDGGTVNYIQHVSQKEIVSVTPDKVVVMFRSLDLTVRKQDRTILQTEQVEALQTYTAKANDVCVCEASIKDFDEHGQAERLARKVSDRFRLSDFEPQDDCHGRDLFKLFQVFLHETGRDDLIPK